ncbi:hypothetical protein L218DRAFT_1004726 [Marasmius fiardii PR-910]|nr:hypothetical protein L218DRAFT_1004726 [Marasmius fiardii PR-910]
MKSPSEAAAAASSQPTAAPHASFAQSIAFSDINPLGRIVSVQGTDNRNRIMVYQEASSGDLVAVGVSNTFEFGLRTTKQTLAPSSQILWGSPFTIFDYQPGPGTPGTVEVFYFGQDYLIKEARWHNQWLTESACGICIQNQGIYRAVRGSNVLSVLESPAGAHAQVSLMFQSVDYPDGVLVEAQRIMTNPWSGVYPLRGQ